MPSRQPARALPWGVFLLLLGLQLLGTQAWPGDQDVVAHYFPATVEFALHTFNTHSGDTYAYKLLRVLGRWREEVGHSVVSVLLAQANPELVFSMELELSRTRCEKFEEDIDNCAFQTPPGNHTIGCFFTIRTEPWKTVFTLLNSTCVTGKA